MDKKKLSDEEIADAILEEVGFTMMRIEDAHKKASKDHELKSDAYSRMKAEGWWNAKKILNKYPIIQKKESLLPSNIRQMIVTIFELASTNFWAKQVRKESETKNRKRTKRGK